MKQPDQTNDPMQDSEYIPLNMFDFLDMGVSGGDGLDVSLAHYYDAMNHCSTKRFASIVLGALSQNPAKVEQAKRVFRSIVIPKKPDVYKY
jgi:hypothetical protein